MQASYAFCLLYTVSEVTKILQLEYLFVVLYLVIVSITIQRNHIPSCDMQVVFRLLTYLNRECSCFVQQGRELCHVANAAY